MYRHIKFRKDRSQFQRSWIETQKETAARSGPRRVNENAPRRRFGGLALLQLRNRPKANDARKARKKVGEEFKISGVILNSRRETSGSYARPCQAISACSVVGVSVYAHARTQAVNIRLPSWQRPPRTQSQKLPEYLLFVKTVKSAVVLMLGKTSRVRIYEQQHELTYTN